MIQNVEKIVSDYLREHPDVDARIVGKTPSDTREAWVKVTQINATNEPGSRPEHLIAYLLQLDCYAGAEGGQPEATALGRDVRSALHAAPDSVAELTQVTFTGHHRLPDPDVDEPARERVILDAMVRAR